MIPEGRVRGMGCRLDTAKHAQFQSPRDARTSRRLIALTRAWTWAVGARVRVACERLRCNECERVHSHAFCEGRRAMRHLCFSQRRRALFAKHG